MYYSGSYIYLSIEGKDEDVTYIDTEISDKIKTMRPWYARYTKVRRFHIVMPLVVVACLTISSLLGYSLGKETIVLKIGSATLSLSDSLLFSFFGSVVLMLLTVLISWGPFDAFAGLVLKFQKHYFPSGVFLIGHQRTNDETTDKRRHLFVTWFWRSVLGAPIMFFLYMVWEKLN